MASTGHHSRLATIAAVAFTIASTSLAVAWPKGAIGCPATMLYVGWVARDRWIARDRWVAKFSWLFSWLFDLQR